MTPPRRGNVAGSSRRRLQAMAFLTDLVIRNRDDLARFEAEMTLEQRLPERSILDVFIAAAARHPERTALTMLMTGAPDEQPRRVSYRELLGLVRRAANLFATLGRPAPRRRLHAAEPGRDPRDAVGRRDRGLRGADQLPAPARAHRGAAQGLGREHPGRARARIRCSTSGRRRSRCATSFPG